MNEQYFFLPTPDGDVYIKTRYFTPINNLCQKVISICVFKNGVVHQIVEHWSQENLDLRKREWEAISKAKFREIQEEHLLIGKWEELFEKFYGLWKEYYVTKQKAISAVKAKEEENQFNYAMMIDAQYKQLDVYKKCDALNKVEFDLRMQNNPSLFEIFEDAMKKAHQEFLQDEYIDIGE